jgi:hypothetical protein
MCTPLVGDGSSNSTSNTLIRGDSPNLIFPQNDLLALEPPQIKNADTNDVSTHAALHV